MRLAVLLPVLTTALAGPLPPVPLYDDIVYTDNNTCFIADHDIAAVYIPLNFDSLRQMFFVQADATNNVNKGLYALHFEDVEFPDIRNVTATKLLDHGTCITSDEQNVYFGSTDGIYAYTNKQVERFGSISANIKYIQKDMKKDLIYIITADDKLYVVINNGNKMVEHGTIKQAHQVVADTKDNLYFITKRDDPENKLAYHEKFSKPKVLVGASELEISGLPDEYANLKLGMFMEHAVALVGNQFYILHPNGTSVDMRMGFAHVPSAFSMDFGLVHLYGYDKKVYIYTGLAEAVAEAIAHALGQFVTKLGSAVRDGIRDTFRDIQQSISS